MKTQEDLPPVVEIINKDALVKNLPPVVEIIDKGDTQEATYYDRVVKLVVKSPDNMKKIITKNNIKIDFSYSKGKYDPYQADVYPSVYGDNKSFICLICAASAAFRSQKKGLKLYSGKYKAQNFRSHARSSHPYIIGGITPEKTLNLLLVVFGTQLKKSGKYRSLTGSSSKSGDEKGVFVKEMSSDVCRVRQGLWIMMSALPSTIVDDERYREFIYSLSRGFKPQSRQTESRMEISIFDVCVAQIKARIKKSAAYFEGSAFLSLECDVWTAQSNMAVLGVGCSFYDVKLEKCITIVLGAVPLLKGKTAVELKAHMLKIMSMFDIKTAWVRHLVGDGEKSVQNALNTLVPGGQFIVDLCLAHELQTWTRHAFGCGQKLYKRDPFEEGHDFFNRIRSLVNIFTKSPLKERKLKRLQSRMMTKGDDKNDEKPTLLGLCKFSATRWSGAYNALARIYRLEACLKLYFTENDEDDDKKLSVDDWKLITEILALMGKFNDITRKVQ